MTIASVFQGHKANSDVEPLWLCIRFSMLPMNVLGARFSCHEAVAVTEQRQIFQVNQAALEASINSGQSLEHALMLLPKLELIERDTKLEAAKLKSLTEWAYRYTSHVHVVDEHSLLLEIGRSLRLFNGLRHLQHLICQALEQLGIDAEFGLAKTPKAARLLSHQRQPEWSLDTVENAIKQGQLEHLDVDPDVIDKLQHCGFRGLGSILKIPKHELGERFGKEFVHYLDQLSGEVADPMQLTTPAESFVGRVNFAEPIRNRTWIEQQIQRLLQDLVRFVQQRNIVCRCLSWRFFSERNHLLKQIDIQLNADRIDFDTLLTLTNLQFENTKMEWAFSSIELISDSLHDKRLYERDLFDTEHDKESINQLLDKLLNRLGHSALYKVSAQAEHLPELVNLRHPVEHKPIEQFEEKERRALADFKDEPLWLLPQPKRLMHQGKQPVYQGKLTLIHGPNRISSHWWTELQSRDYYIFRQQSGRLIWVYYDRIHKHWYLHGLYA